MVLPSNSSMRYFPDNKTGHFITELPQAVRLHGEWEVALTEIQFPSTFLHINYGENVLRFVDIDPAETKKEKDAPPPSTREAVIPAGIYKNIDALIGAINKACKEAKSHFDFELQNDHGGQILFMITCNEADCKLVHHLNVSDNLLRILGTGSNIATVDGSDFFTSLTAAKAYSKTALYTATFIKFGERDKKTGKRVLSSAFWAVEPYSLARGIRDKLFVYCDICLMSPATFNRRFSE